MWFAPSVLIAVTKRWQTGIPLGQGYISVVYEYFGLALCILSLWLVVSRRLHISERARALHAWNVGSAIALALMATMTLAGNLSLMP